MNLKAAQLGVNGERNIVSYIIHEDKNIFLFMEHPISLKNYGADWKNFFCVCFEFGYKMPMSASANFKSSAVVILKLLRSPSTRFILTPKFSAKVASSVNERSVIAE